MSVTQTVTISSLTHKVDDEKVEHGWMSVSDEGMEEP